MQGQRKFGLTESQKGLGIHESGWAVHVHVVEYIPKTSLEPTGEIIYKPALRHYFQSSFSNSMLELQVQTPICRKYIVTTHHFWFRF